MKFLNYFSLSFLVYFFLILNTTSAQSKQSFQLRADGSIKVWTMLGPFPNGKGGGHSEGCIGYYTDFLRDEGGETKAIPSQGDTVIFGSKSKRIWKTEFSDDSGFLDFLRIFRVSTSVPYAGYAFCQLNSDEEKPAVFKISSDDGVRVWLNDKMVHDNHIGRGVDEGIDTVFVKLKRGDNRLLVKVDQGNGGWGLIFHVTGKNGSPLEGVTSVVSLPSSISGKILEANITSTDFVENTDEGSKQIIFADILSGGVKNTSCAVNTGERSRPLVTQIGDLSLGRHQVRITIPEISGNIKADFTFRYNGGKFAVKNVGLKKSREWTLYLVQHAHTDIGYTRPQHEILPEHLRYIDYALDMCDLTDSYPDDAKFRWTCEAAWTVREYLNRRPASQIERLKNRIKEGRIEVTGMFFNFSELPDENLMASSLKPVKKFKDEGIPVVAAMQNDVNGLAWCLVDYFSSIGIKYATMGINNDRSILPFSKPTAFWWESPSGNKLLAFRADHYMTGNSFGLQTGKIAKAEPAVSNYLKDLEKKQYPFSRIAVQFSGYVTDNSPPSLAACRLVKDWNEKYKWPHLRISTAREFLRYVENNHADELEVYKAAWPDWWTDGFASAARETGIVRNAQTAMIVNNSLLSMACLMGEKIAPTVLQRITQINDQLLFYDEHTFGAAESISDPYAQNSMLQWGEKSAFAYSALRESGMLREEAIGLLLGKISKDSVPSVCVFNTLNWKRSGIAEVFIDHEMLPSVSGYKIVDAETNQPAAHSLIKSRPEGNYWKMWVNDVPAMGMKKLLILKEDNNKGKKNTVKTSFASFENKFYRIEIDKNTGGISVLFDKQLNKNLTDNNCKWKPGQLIYETLKNRGDYSSKSIKRTSVKNVKISPIENSSLWKSVKISADADGFVSEEKGAAGIQFEIRLYNFTKRIDFIYDVRKAEVTNPEAVYVAFPFNMPGFRIAYEAQGGSVAPGIDQLPGSASDWHTVQNYALLRNDNEQIVIGCNEAPLMEFGGLNLGKYQYIEKVNKPYIFSYVMNNYWHTNFRASQRGEIKWSYYFTSGKDTGEAAASKFGWSSRIPLAGSAIEAGNCKNSFHGKSLLNIENDNILLIGSSPSDNGKNLILHLREIAGKGSVVKLNGVKIKSADLVDVLGEVTEKNLTEIKIKPYESIFVRLNLQK